MISVGWTGSRVAQLPVAVFSFVQELLERVPRSDRQGVRLVTGACVGIDELVARLGHRAGYPVHTVVPWNRSMVDREWKRWASSFEEMPAGTSYRDRNYRLVILSNHLNAFPALDERDRRSLRSGTWQTVRLARGISVPVEVYVIADITGARS